MALQPVDPWSVVCRYYLYYFIFIYTPCTPSYWVEHVELFVEFSLLTKSLYSSELVPTKNMQICSLLKIRSCNWSICRCICGYLRSGINSLHRRGVCTWLLSNVMSWLQRSAMCCIFWLMQSCDIFTATRYIEVLSTGVSWWIWSIHARNILAAEVFYLAFPEYAACVKVDDWTFELQEHSRKRDEALARKWWFGNVFAEYPASWVFEIEEGEPHWDAKTTEHGTWLSPCTMGHHGTMRP